MVGINGMKKEQRIICIGPKTEERESISGTLN
jgi:hypothetical protein